MELPKGPLVIVFANPQSASDRGTWQVEWQPDHAREFKAEIADASICWNADTFQNVPMLPEGLDGKVIFTQLNPDLQIVMANMDGSQQQIIAKSSSRASLALNADKLVFSASDGLMIFNIHSGETRMIPGNFGRDAHFSPDGRQIAYVNSGESFGVFIINDDGDNQKQLSNLGYESIAGWSPDSSLLYYAIPGSSGNGFMLRSVNVFTSKIRDLFILENSSRKAPMPAISPDGQWIAYRAEDNSSLYLKRMDGSPAHLVLDNPAAAINGIAWEKEGYLLGVSMITSQSQDGEIVLITPDSCETYRLDRLSGELDAVFIP